MSRNTNVRFVKPRLEQLEERAQPSFLLGSNAVQQLATPLNNMVSDLVQARTNLETTFNFLHFPQNPKVNLEQAERNFAQGAASWQRMLNDQHAISAFSNAAVSFINTVALSEAANGDATDLLILSFGGLFGLQPLKPLTDPVARANAFVNAGDVQFWVNTSFSSTTPLTTSSTFSQVVLPPLF